MGEYIKNPNAIGEEIKIAVCRGKDQNDWEIFFSKEMLTLLADVGFKSWYASEYEEGNNLLMFINSYDELNTSSIYYKTVDDIIKEYPEYEKVLKS